MNDDHRTSGWHKRVIVLATVGLLTTAAFFILRTQARQRAESVNCGNYMASICMAARMWANDNNDRLPPDLLTMSNELISPKILHCPGDRIRERVRTWAEFSEAMSSYEVKGPGVQDGDANAVFLRCRIHGHSGYADGTVFDGKRRRGKVLF